MSDLLVSASSTVSSSTADPQQAVTHHQGRLTRQPVPGDAARHDRPGPQDLERMVRMSTRRAARFAAFAETHNVGTEALDQLRADVCVLANDYLREPLAVIMGDLIETQENVFRLLEGRQRPGQARELHVLAGVVSGLLAKTSQDLGRMHDAMTQARTLYVCADNADHVPLRAWARGLQSLIAYWADRPQEAVRYAQAGTDLVARQNGSVGAWLAGLEARAWAMLGAATETTQAVARCEERRARLEPDDLDAIGGLLSFGVAKQHYYTAGALVLIDGEETSAQAEAARAIELFESSDAQVRPFGDEAGARSELALARVRGGAVDGAWQALAPVLELAPDKRIGGIVTSVVRVHEALRARPYASSPVARDFRGQIEEFCQVPVSALSA